MKSHKTIKPNLTLLFILPFMFILGLGSVQAQKKYTTEDPSAIKLYETGKTALVQRDYETASKNFKKALLKDYGFVEAHIQMAKIYKMNFVPKMEQLHYEEAIKHNKSAKRFTVIYYTLGNLYFRQGEYAKSQDMYSQYVESGKGKAAGLKEAKRNLIVCDFAVEAMKDSSRVEPKMMPPQVNMFSAQYFPSLTANEYFMVFTALTGQHNRKVLKDQNGKQIYNEVKRDENVLATRKNEDGEWQAAVSISTNINTQEYSEGATAISGDGRSLILTICNHLDGKGSCDLYSSRRTGDEWTKPVNLGDKVNTQYKETYPTLSPDGRTLYFCSDRPGGKGKLDIWRSQLGEDGWESPDNLGEPINSPGNEISPFIHANDHTLYFGSDYHIGFGGYDNFMSEVTLDSWTKPKNLGYPINTYQDEGTMFISPNGQKGYYSKRLNKAASAEKRQLNIKLFEFDVPADIRPSILAGYAQGEVLDIETNEKLEAKIELYDLTSTKLKLLEMVYSDEEHGDYVVTLNHGGEYALYVTREGYLFQSLNFNFLEDSVQAINLDIYLKPIQVGQSIVLNNMFFETDSYELSSKSETELSRIKAWMEENESRIEISGFTDNVGADSYNQKLSVNRAKAVYKYLVKAGISEGYLTYKGYGKNNPIATNDTEVGRTKNRRIEFKIIAGFDD